MTPVQIALVAGGVIALLALILNGGKIKDGIAAMWGKVKSGDLAGAVFEAVKSSDIVRKAETLGAEAGNIVSYTDMKIASVHVPQRVDPDKVAETVTAFNVILTNLATANLLPETTPAPKASRVSSSS